MTADYQYTSDPIPFDLYYEWLKEFVADPEARKHAERYFSAVERFVKEGGREEFAYSDDAEAESAVYDYRKVGIKILERNGWPSLAELWKQGKKDEHRDILRKMRLFSQIGAAIIRGGYPIDFGIETLRGLQLDISDKELIRNYLKLVAIHPTFGEKLNLDLGIKND